MLTCCPSVADFHVLLMAPAEQHAARCAQAAAGLPKTLRRAAPVLLVRHKCAAVLPQVMEAVETAFVERFGPYAGWAHNTLFIAELASQQVPLDAVHTCRDPGFSGRVWAAPLCMHRLQLGSPSRLCGTCAIVYMPL